MALERGKLSNVVQVAAGTTVGIICCCIQKGLCKIHHCSCCRNWYCYCNWTSLLRSNGNTAGATNKIFDVDIISGETVLLEPSYPLCWTTGDALFVGTGNVTGIAATHVNFIITGDKDLDTYSN